MFGKTISLEIAIRALNLHAKRHSAEETLVSKNALQNLLGLEDQAFVELINSAGKTDRIGFDRAAKMSAAVAVATCFVAFSVLVAFVPFRAEARSPMSERIAVIESVPEFTEYEGLFEHPAAAEAMGEEEPELCPIKRVLVEIKRA
jgi:hypothetical protein